MSKQRVKVSSLNLSVIERPSCDQVESEQNQSIGRARHYQNSISQIYIEQTPKKFIISISGKIPLEDEHQLQQQQVTHVLSLIPGVRVNSSIKQKIVPHLQDSPENLIHPLLLDLFDFIEDCRGNGGHCLVHCYAGKSRSSTVVIAYLMWLLKQPKQQIFESVQKGRPCIEPNIVFFNELNCLEKWFNDPSNVILFRLILYKSSAGIEANDIVPVQINSSFNNCSAPMLDHRFVYIACLPNMLCVWLGYQSTSSSREAGLKVARQLEYYLYQHRQLPLQYNVYYIYGVTPPDEVDASTPRPFLTPKTPNCVKYRSEGKQPINFVVLDGNKMDVPNAEMHNIVDQFNEAVQRFFSEVAQQQAGDDTQRSLVSENFNEYDDLLVLPSTSEQCVTYAADVPALPLGLLRRTDPGGPATKSGRYARQQCVDWDAIQYLKVPQTARGSSDTRGVRNPRSLGSGGAEKLSSSGGVQKHSSRSSRKSARQSKRQLSTQFYGWDSGLDTSYQTIIQWEQQQHARLVQEQEEEPPPLRRGGPISEVNCGGVRSSLVMSHSTSVCSSMCSADGSSSDDDYGLYFDDRMDEQCK